MAYTGVDDSVEIEARFNNLTRCDTVSFKFGDGFYGVVPLDKLRSFVEESIGYVDNTDDDDDPYDDPYGESENGW